MESRLGGMEEKKLKLIEMQSKTSPTILITNPNQDCTGIPLTKTKGKEIGREKFNDDSFFHQEPPFKASIRCESGFLDWGGVGAAKRKFFGGGGRMANHYGMHFGQWEWAIKGGDQEPPPRGPIRDVIGFSDGGTKGREFCGEGGGVTNHYGRSFGQGEWTTRGGGVGRTMWITTTIALEEEEAIGAVAIPGTLHISLDVKQAEYLTARAAPIHPDSQESSSYGGRMDVDPHALPTLGSPRYDDNLLKLCGNEASPCSVELCPARPATVLVTFEVLPASMARGNHQGYSWAVAAGLNAALAAVSAKLFASVVQLLNLYPLLHSSASFQILCAIIRHSLLIGSSSQFSHHFKPMI
ncbi:hypothetical protein KFK09_018175 [Dendrobium nobile]|uniref:Uncharacterized protein n=1 Tax=Dendrobium nobile TaxID=94219 RepID=A0A8T3AV39_DENNO|nr:hypothetical protein KFK09_018175 [Dendrobium nobile]